MHHLETVHAYVKVCASVTEAACVFNDAVLCTLMCRCICMHVRPPRRKCSVLVLDTGYTPEARSAPPKWRGAAFAPSERGAGSWGRRPVQEVSSERLTSLPRADPRFRPEPHYHGSGAGWASLGSSCQCRGGEGRAETKSKSNSVKVRLAVALQSASAR